MLKAFTDYTRFVLTALLSGISFQENSMLSSVQLSLDVQEISMHRYHHFYVPQLPETVKLKLTIHCCFTWGCLAYFAILMNTMLTY